jgi:uncharacterized membrane protein YqjE
MAQRVLEVGENRFELVVLELQEERERLLRSILVALGALASGLLTGVAFTIGVIILLWEQSPLIALAVLTPVYAIATVLLVMWLLRMQREWHSFSTSLEEFRKDRQCLQSLLR